MDAVSSTNDDRRTCTACRGTGKLTSGLGGTPHEVTCPWCGGSGEFDPTSTTLPNRRPFSTCVSASAATFSTTAPSVDTWLRANVSGGPSARADQSAAGIGPRYTPFGLPPDEYHRAGAVRR